MIIDKHPNAFQLKHDKENGCFLSIYLNLIEIPPKEVHQVEE
jgi:hypothetical protein